MQPITLRLSQIHADSAFNCRKAVVPLRPDRQDPDPIDTIAALADSIRRDGLLVPLIVRQVEGMYRLVAGFRRHAAFELIARADGGSDPEVRCELMEGSDVDAMVVNAVENMRRGGLRLWEVADRCAELAKMGMAQVEIARRLGRSHGNVSLLICLVRDLAPEIQKAWRSDNGACGFQRLTEWHVLPHTEQLVLFDKACGGDGSGVAIQEGAMPARRGEGAQRMGTGTRRRRSGLAAALAVCEETRGAYAAGAAAALKFAMGQEETIGDLFDPKMVRRKRRRRRVA